MHEPGAVRFVVDSMLIRLGKYLRIIGADAVWDAGMPVGELVRRANEEGRVFLTGSRRLDEDAPRPDRVMLVEGQDPVAQLRAVIKAYGIDPQADLFTRCIRCNVPLAAVADREAIRSRVEPGVFERHRRFFTCPSCGTLFWFGSHVLNTCRKLGLRPPAEG